MIQIVNVSKQFETKDGTVKALDGVFLTIEDKDIYGIIGMSGAGKSTLVRMMNMLERPTEGQVLVDGVDVGSLSEKELRTLRRSTTMIFQGFHLLMQKNVLQNVAFPLLLEGVGKKEANAKALELLALVGLEEKAKSYPAQLSGGQQQRVAIARALATNPKVLLCDEATSALDPVTTQSILALLRDINESLGVTVILITHQMSVVTGICKHVAILEQGKVAEQGEVTEVFSNPSSEAAKKLVLPQGEEEIDLPEQPNMIRVVFRGAPSLNQPLVTSLARDKGICANIAYASTKGIGGKAYGTIILSFENQEEKEEAIRYFQSAEGVRIEEWNHGR